MVLWRVTVGKEMGIGSRRLRVNTKGTSSRCMGPLVTIPTVMLIIGAIRRKPLTLSLGPRTYKMPRVSVF